MNLRLLALPALALLGLSLTACDSAKDDSDAATIEGQWKLQTISDQNNSSAGSSRDLTSAFNGLVNELSFDFDDGEYTLMVDYNSAVNNAPAPNRRDDVTLSGEYTVSESAKTITLKVPLGTGGATTPVTFSYVFDSDRQITLTGNADATSKVNLVLNPTTAYATDLKIVITRK